MPLQSATGEGQIVFVQAADIIADTKKIIPDLAVWLQCFAVYVAALAPPSDCLQDLMAYQSFIFKCGLKYRWSSWVVYDQNFCLEDMEVANQPDRVWAQSDPRIYAQSFTNLAFQIENWCTECQSLDHSWGACPRRPRKYPQSSTFVQTYNRSNCNLFNKYNGDCTFGLFIRVSTANTRITIYSYLTIGQLASSSANNLNPTTLQCLEVILSQSL